MSPAILRYDCNCDTVLAMEGMGVGVEEILQYARAVLPRREVWSLLQGLESILDRGVRVRLPAGQPDTRSIMMRRPSSMEVSSWHDETM